MIYVVDEQAKGRKYGIHPLLQRYADSIKDHKNFRAPYLEAKGRFYEIFILRVKNIVQLIDPDYVKAFHFFDTDKGNYEFTIDTGCYVKVYCWINLKWMSIEVIEAWTPF